MKKTVLFLLFGLLVVLVSCNNANNGLYPANITVEDGIFTCDTYDQAMAYEINLTSNSIDLTYEVANQFDLNYLVLNGSYTFRVRAVLENGVYSEYSKEMNIEITDSLKKNILTGESLHDEAYMEIHGRTLYDETSEAQMLYYTASGFEVSFYGTSLDLILTSDNATDKNKQAYISVVIDDSCAPYEGTTYTLTQSELLLYIADELDEGFHTASFYKVNESLDNNIGIKRVKTDGFFVDPKDDEEQLNIQYIGASTTTGYGDLATSPTASKTSANSNGLLAFTSLSAYMLNANWSITSASGWGISRGWNTNGALNASLNIPSAFDYVAINSNGQVLDTLWNQEQFVPDIYVINLGSNDFNTSNYSNLSETEKASFEQTFVNDYKAFILKLHTYAPDAIIIITYGILSKLEVVETLTLEAAQQARTEFTNIFTLELMTGSDFDYPYGANYHPNILTHLEAAKDLASLMSQLTGQPIVHDDIVLSN
ncbi:MAG: SGNH/GDSL hydrolase family protein [Acholeplasmataceae bacterium]